MTRKVEWEVFAADSNNGFKGQQMEELVKIGIVSGGRLIIHITKIEGKICESMVYVPDVIGDHK